MRTAFSTGVAIFLLASAKLAGAADVKVETALTDLEHPTAVAIRPGGMPDRYEVLVAETGGGRVLKTTSSQPHEKTDVITGFPPSAADESSDKDVSHALIFLDERRLVAGLAGAPPEVRLFELKEDMPIKADQAAQKVTPELDSSADVPSGRCVGLARTRANDVVPDMLLIAFSGDARLNGVWKLPVRAGMLSTLTPLADSAGAVAGKPTAITISEQGYLLIAAPSAGNETSSLVFVNPTSGEPVLSIETPLTEIGGLAYSPKSGHLYAIAIKKSEAGLFRIDDSAVRGKPGVTETKVADIPRPTALAFGPDGALYVTATGDESATSKSGGLLRITGDF